jgi:hypothetical protein
MQLSKALVVLMLFALSTGGFFVSCVSANPISPPLITIASPVNNHVYFSNQVQLNFTTAPYSYVNFTEFTYRLDNQPWQATNGTPLLEGLAAGSHTLTIHGKGNYSSYSDTSDAAYDSTLTVVYFSVDFSTAWMTLTLSASAAIGVTVLILFKTRTRLVAAIKHGKRPRFWAGLISVVFGALIFVSSFWKLASDYVTPVYPRPLVAELVPASYLAVLGLLLICFGGFCMCTGTKKPRIRHTFILPFE